MDMLFLFLLLVAGVQANIPLSFGTPELLKPAKAVLYTVTPLKDAFIVPQVCGYDPSQYIHRPNYGLVQLNMFERRAGISCKLCLRYCTLRQGGTFSCRSVVYDHKWKVCDLYAMTDAPTSKELVSMVGKDFFEFLLANDVSHDEHKASDLFNTEEHLRNAVNCTDLRKKLRRARQKGVPVVEAAPLNVAVEDKFSKRVGLSVRQLQEAHKETLHKEADGVLDNILSTLSRTQTEQLRQNAIEEVKKYELELRKRHEEQTMTELANIEHKKLERVDDRLIGPADTEDSLRRQLEREESERRMKIAQVRERQRAEDERIRSLAAEETKKKDLRRIQLRLREEQRRQRVQEMERVVERQRKEEETQRLAQAERQRKEEETQRLAQAERKRKEEETQRLAQVEKQRLAEKQRLEDLQRQAETQRFQAHRKEQEQKRKLQEMLEEQERLRHSERKRKEEMERKLEEAERQRKMEEERERSRKEAADRQRRLQEAERQRKLEEEEKQRRLEEERERIQREEEERQRKLEEERERRRQEEAERQRKLEEADRQRKLEEERRKVEEEKEQIRREEEARLLKIAEEKRREKEERQKAEEERQRHFLEAQKKRQDELRRMQLQREEERREAFERREEERRRLELEVEEKKRAEEARRAADIRIAQERRDAEQKRILDDWKERQKAQLEERQAEANRLETARREQYQKSLDEWKLKQKEKKAVRKAEETDQSDRIILTTEMITSKAGAGDPVEYQTTVCGPREVSAMVVFGDTKPTSSDHRPVRAASLNQCLNNCRSDEQCTSASFSIDGCKTSQEFWLAQPDAAVEQTEDHVYLEKICLLNVVTDEPNVTLAGEAYKVQVGSVLQVEDTASLDECVSLCIKAQRSRVFDCKSVMFYPDDQYQNCLLNTESHSTKPENFISQNTKVVYVETPREAQIEPFFAMQKDTPLPKEYTGWSKCKGTSSYRFKRCKEFDDVRRCPKETAKCQMKEVKIGFQGHRKLNVKKLKRSSKSSSTEPTALDAKKKLMDNEVTSTTAVPRRTTMLTKKATTPMTSSVTEPTTADPATTPKV